MLDEDTLIDMSDPNFGEKLEFAMVAIIGSSTYRNDRERPYNGQSHTDHGERGKTLVEGLTMRDVADCIVQGFLAASGNTELYRKTIPMDEDDIDYKTGDWRYEDVYKIPTNIDPQAVIQNTMCFIEKYMGIFPNVKPFKMEDLHKELS
jgi:hypothetical protein